VTTLTLLEFYIDMMAWWRCCWWRGIVVRPPVLPVCFPCPALDWQLAVWVKCPLSVSQQGRLSLLSPGVG